ncbi:hypothetical protein NEK97_02465 [Paenarthrobacter sp. UW852]|uniref:hypothetical protein n=1 Tax=Paenarthrobacter sp. UW852 TaxID=2951989 RepID=UPI002148A100|nr:hypothetical protein [Paenarthrobacter sp. UW852]MCR1160324.1 hypothetical protein [Paenarthrobacter sp. UW852]
MSTDTSTNVFQSQRFWTFTANVAAGLVASVIVLCGQGLGETFSGYLKDNQNILENSAFYWLLVLLIIPIAGIAWGIWEAKKTDSGRTNKSVFLFLGAMGFLLVTVLLIGFALLVLQSAVNIHNQS